MATKTMMIGKNRVRQRPSTFYWIKWHFRLFFFFFIFFIFSFFRRRFSFVFVAMEETRPRFLPFDIRSLKILWCAMWIFHSFNSIAALYDNSYRWRRRRWLLNAFHREQIDDNGGRWYSLLPPDEIKIKTSMGNFHRRITYWVMNFVHEFGYVCAVCGFCVLRSAFAQSATFISCLHRDCVRIPSTIVFFFSPRAFRISVLNYKYRRWRWQWQSRDVYWKTRFWSAWKKSEAFFIRLDGTRSIGGQFECIRTNLTIVFGLLLPFSLYASDAHRPLLFLLA